MTTLMVPALRSAATRNASGASSIGYRWQHTAHHAEVGAGIVWAADEFDGWPEYVHRRLRVPATTPRSALARFWSDCIFVSRLLGKRDGREHAIRVVVSLRRKQPYSVVAVCIRDLFVVVGPEQVGVAAG